MCPFLGGSLYLVLAVWAWNIAVICGYHTCSTGEDYDCNGLTICYWLVKSNLNADDADLECQYRGGFLAYIPNQDAMDTVRRLTDSQSQFFFIGYEEDAGVVRIRHTSREQKYTDWYNAQPNRADESCVVIISGKWHDISCSSQYYAVCSIYVPGRSVTEYPQCSGYETTTTEDVPATSTIDTTILETTEQPITTTESTTTQINTEALTTTSDQCQCTCSYINKTINIQEMTEQIKKEMTVDKTTLSSHIRKLNSAEDSRVSSARIGYVGILIIALVLGCILFIDIFQIIQNCKAMIG